MGLLSALSNAVSGLSVNQQNLNVLSQNISNANTPNYSREVVNQQAHYDAGMGTGVTIEGIKRTVDQFLTQEVQTQTSVNSSAATVQGYYSQIENLLGQPGATNSLDQGINSFFSSLQTLANNPSASSQTGAINAGVTLAGQISGLAGSLQSLRLQSDSEINTSVNSINTDLQTLFTTNSALERATATGQNTTGLLDQRDAALSDLAQYVDIKPSYQLDGEVELNTTNGLTLLGGSNTLYKLTYTPAQSVSSLTSNLPLSPIQIIALDSSGKQVGPATTLVTGGASSTVTSSLTGGKLQGLLSVRDSIVPNILSQLDQLAANLRDGLNAVANQGVSFPPPNSYTGQRQVTASNATQWSGDVQIALLDSNGNPVNSPYSDEPNGLEPITLNLGALTGSGGTGVLSASDIANAINQAYGPPQNKAEFGNINNVQLGVLSSSVPSSSNSLSFDFNLNDISSGNGQFFLTGVTVADSSGTNLSSGNIASNVPSVSVTGYTASAADTVTVSAANSFVNGETIYLNTPTTSVGGQPLAAGYYTVSNATGSGFDITLAGVTAGGSLVSVSGATALPPYATVNSGDTLRTGANGSVTLSNLNTLSSTTPYYVVNATVGTLDASGNVITSTITYRIPNNGNNTLNNLIGANSATAGTQIVSPGTIQPLVTATLVDANGNALPKTNGSYGNQQGYLKITANNSSYTVAVNELDSKQLGLPNATIPVAGTNQGFSQYFGLNNIFNPNSLTTTGDTVAGSALNMAVTSRLINNPGLIPTATLAQGLQPSNPNSPPNFTYIVAAGDNSISQQLAGIATQAQSFAVAGGLPPTSTTFSQYAGQIIAKTSNDSSDATNSMNDSQTLLSGYSTRAQAVSGVNLDQELANTVVYQNAYTASTRVITVVSAMFNELLGIIQ